MASTDEGVDDSLPDLADPAALDAALEALLLVVDAPTDDEALASALDQPVDRVRAAVVNAGASFPLRRITIGLSPAAMPKQGSGFDLSACQLQHS